VAVSWATVPVAIVRLWGATLTDCSVAAVAVRMAVPETDPNVAVMVALPAVSALARPELLTVAILPSLDVQVAELVMSCVVASVKVAVAVNCAVVFVGTEGFAGVTVIRETVALVTVNTVLPLIDPEAAVMIALPVAALFAKPLTSTVAMVESEELHVAEERVWVLLSVNNPTALIWVEVPSDKEGVDGSSEMETSCAGRTVKPVVPVTEPSVALITTFPGATVVANPLLSIVTSVVSEEVQFTEVRTVDRLSLNIPVATKDWEMPSAIDAWSGERTIEVSVGAITVATVEPAIDPRVAVTVACPAATAIAIPTLLTVTTDESDDDHMTCAVTSCELASLQVPVAVNCCDPFARSEGVEGLTAIEVKIGVTAMILEPLTDPMAADIVVVPALSPVAMPEPLTLATLTEVDDQVACVVTFLLLPSLYEPVAVNCCVPFTITDWLPELTAIERSKGVVEGGGVVEPLLPPHPTVAKANATIATAANSSLRTRNEEQWVEHLSFKLSPFGLTA
jgi:hypothetical protein